MLRPNVAVTSILFCSWLLSASDHKPLFITYDVARVHEIKPHRRTIPHEGIRPGFNQLRIVVSVSASGDVITARATGDPKLMAFWPGLEAEVRGWKFVPFERDGKAVLAEVEEYIDLVPPERLPQVRIPAPVIQPRSVISITLERSGCFGSCPSYVLTVSSQGVIFEGRAFVVAEGRHTGRIDADEVRRLAEKFISADFYSMDRSYSSAVTDNPTYELSISIDGHMQQVRDYVGAWSGMPAVISELEDEVDWVGRTDRWIYGSDGLVKQLKAEKFDFKTGEAQAMLKASARLGQTATVQQLLFEGVPLNALSASEVGWLTAASKNPGTLKLLIEAGASKYDQADKDLALVGAAGSGQVEAARALIAYGADPKADLTKLVVTEDSGGMTMQGPGAGSVLIYAASSGKPQMLREILRYHPGLEARDREGKTAMFAAGEYRNSDEDGDRVECVRLLAQEGADVNARDHEGNTPLHETFLTDVEEELLRLGANVNARNNEGEMPIFTTYDDDAILLFVKHGADLSIRNNKGQTVVEAAKQKSAQRQAAIRRAIAEASLRK